jgi:hypothetical protein
MWPHRLLPHWVGNVLFSSLFIPCTAIATQDPIAHYPLDGDASDVSGNARNGTVFGAVPVPDRFGAPNAAMSFDGVNDWIRALGDGLPTTSRTVTLWFLADQFDNHPVFLGYGGGSCGTSFFVGVNTPVFGIGPYVSSHCNVNTLINTMATPPTGNWQHCAVTTDADGTRIYLNGGLIATNTNFMINTITTGTDLAIGVDVAPSGIAPYVDGNVSYFDGVLDDVRIYDRALSASEIATLAAGAVGVATDGMQSTSHLSLGPSVPNPSFAEARIAFEIPQRGHVQLSMYDVTGARIATIFDGVLEAGFHGATWNGLTEDGKPAAAGVYFSVLSTDSDTRTRKLIRLH